MRRSEFSRLTGFTPGAINNLARRDEFPFLRRVVENQSGWSDYPPRLAFMALLAYGLADSGVTLERAGRFVDLEFDDLLRPRGIANLMSGQVLFGFADWGSTEFDPQKNARLVTSAQIPLCGTYEEIGTFLGPLKQADPSADILALVLVNASHRLRLMRDNAADRGLSKNLLKQVLGPRSPP